MADILTVADLESAKQDDTFHAEVITGKLGGNGADIDFATHARTGQIQMTLPAMIRNYGFGNSGLEFGGGGFLNSSNLLVKYNVDNSFYRYIGTGTFPIAIPAAPDSNWQEFVATVHNALSGRDDVGAHDSIYTRNYPTVASMIAESLQFTVDNVYSTGGTKWRLEDGTSPITIDNFHAFGAINIKDFGAIGDGVTDNTVSIQAALNSGSNIYIPSGNFISDELTVPDSVSMICGEGAQSRITLKAGDNKTLLTCENLVTLKNFRLHGGSGLSQKEQITSTANRNGLHIATQKNSLVDGLTIEGFENYGLRGIDSVGGLLERYAVTNCTFKKNWTGCDTGLFGEYTRYNNNDVTDNYFGIRIRSGNVICNSNKIIKNGVGVFIDGNNTNDGHGNLVGCTINHNTTAFFAQNVENGFNVQGNQMFEGIIKIENSTGVMIHGGIINATEFRLDSQGGLNYILHNEMFPSYGNTITRLTGDKTLLIDNFFNDGSYLGNVTSRKLVIKEVGATVDVDGLSGFPTWKSSASATTSSTCTWGQTNATACTWDNNNATRPYKFQSSAVDRFTIHSSALGGAELHSAGAPYIARSPDGTAYKLAAPNGGGAAIWVAV